jgi:energy-coupling factor transport system permease protein
MYFSADLWMLHARMTYGGILYSVSMCLRLLIFVGISLLLIMSTRYEDFVKGLRKLGVPGTFAFSLGLALRSTTYLSADLRNVMDAQRSRGLDLEKGGLLKFFGRLMSLFIPMIVSLLYRSRNVSEAMQCKAFGLGKPSTYRDLRLKTVDYAVILMLLALIPVLTLGPEYLL